jgi:hypothetical protein
MIMEKLSSEHKKLTDKFEQDLLQLYGSPLLTGEQLQKAMSYRSIYALRQAITRKTIPIPIFKIKKRKGHFALVEEVACWLASIALSHSKKEEGN